MAMGLVELFALDKLHDKFFLCASFSPFFRGIFGFTTTYKVSLQCMY